MSGKRQIKYDCAVDRVANAQLAPAGPDIQQQLTVRSSVRILTGCAAHPGSLNAPLITRL